MRKSPQNPLLGHQQRGRRPPEDLGYRAHVVHDKVHVPARSTPGHVKSTHNTIQFSRLLGINPWGASADCGALGAPYPHKKPTWRDWAFRCVSVYPDRWTLGSLRLPPPAPGRDGLQEAPTHSKRHATGRRRTYTKPCACTREEASSGKTRAGQPTYAPQKSLEPLARVVAQTESDPATYNVSQSFRLVCHV